MAGKKGRSGRKPKPTAVRRREGNRGRRALNTREPVYQALVTSADPPESLSPIGAEEWRRVVPILVAQQVLTVADLTVLEGYCLAYQTARAIDELLTAQGLLLKDEEGEALALRHPLLMPRFSAWREVRAYATELGLSPSSRARIAAPRQDPLARLSDYLARRNG